MCLVIILLLVRDKMFLEFFSPIPHTVPPQMLPSTKATSQQDREEIR